MSAYKYPADHLQLTYSVSKLLYLHQNKKESPGLLPDTFHMHEGWQTSGSMKVVRMAFNLYCNGTPSVDDYTKTEEQVNECRQYTVEDLFCCAYAPFFWQAIQIRYPEYATYNRELYALFGGAD